MSLRDELRAISARPDDARKRRFRKFGIIENPFPPAGQPAGNPHHASSVDSEVTSRIKSFYQDRTSQVLLIEGIQGVGKTNLLTHYESELREAIEDEPAYYVIRYYMDPEPSFDGILRRLFQELGTAHLARFATALAELEARERDRIIESARGPEMRIVIRSLVRAAEGDDFVLGNAAETALEWLTGMRLLNKHREALGVQFRLDTVESKTQALRDLVHCSSEADVLKGVFLLLDELEKQDYSVSKMVLLRYLSAIRAIIDALPGYLFLMIALTPEARRRYYGMLPAFQGRLQTVVTLSPLTKTSEAIELSRFYLEAAKKKAADAMQGTNISAGSDVLLQEQEVRDVFERCADESAERGGEGVTQRDFLNALHEQAVAVLSQLG
ncbi:MAG TPA: hypothetical protein VIK18_21050 [Pirellulales bacterium]